MLFGPRPLEPLGIAERSAAGEVGRLARIAPEGRVDEPGRISAEIGRRRVQIGQLFHREARAEPLAQLLDQVVGDTAVGAVVGLGEPPLAFLPLK